MNAHTKQLVVRAILSLVFVGVGVLHFTNADDFVRIVPPYLPFAPALVLVSGVFEILGGLGLWAPSERLRRLAAYGIIALLVSVYIVNVDMAIHGSPLRDGREVPGGDVTLWLRLPLQFVMMWMALYATRPLSSTR